MDAKQSSLELLRYWDLSGEESDTFVFFCEYTPPPSSFSYHHRHHGQHHRYYHRKGNPSIRLPYYLIALRILQVRSIFTPNSIPYIIHLLSFVASSCFIPILTDIALPPTSHLFPTSRLLRYPAYCSPERTPTFELSLCRMGIPVVSYLHSHWSCTALARV
jgi:hypothetical protein